MIEGLRDREEVTLQCLVCICISDSTIVVRSGKKLRGAQIFSVGWGWEDMQNEEFLFYAC